VVSAPTPLSHWRPAFVRPTSWSARGGCVVLDSSDFVGARADPRVVAAVRGVRLRTSTYYF
jgi:hypothetical protein